MHNFHTIPMKDPSYSLVLFSSCNYTSQWGLQTLLTVKPSIFFFALWVIFHVILVHLSSFTKRHSLIVTLHPNYEIQCSVLSPEISRDLPVFHEHLDVAPEIGHCCSFRVVSSSVDNYLSAPHSVLENKHVHGRMQQHPGTPERYLPYLLFLSLAVYCYH